ncbi:Annexin-like protein RJ4 [Glycine soja]|uniref:Annexin-like protein RJ4 n=1 Tax=Glycine soja TaxID=3848 RepID=A0A445I7D8_GLYSO|nr:Annexin-like protein RJ4 [Glycine soja]
MATLVAPRNHFPQEDAEALWKAVKGWGTDEKTIIKILGHRNASQRQQIRLVFQDIHLEDLVKRLESELSGDFERAVYRWTLEPSKRYAVLANVAIKNANKDYHVMVEILWVGLVSSFRYGGDEINARLAKSEANILHEAIKDKESFKDENNISISKKLLEETSDDFYKAVNVAIHCINDHKKYYEKVLRNAIKGVGNNEDGQTRVFVTRAEKDLKDIKELYYKKNSVHLEDTMAKENSGYYKKFLLTLLGKGG